MSFRDTFSLRDPNGSVQLVQTRIKNARIFCDYLAEYFSARREAEDAYVKHLSRISRRFAPPDAAFVPTGFGDVLDRLQTEITDVIKAHATLERRLQRDCEDPLRSAPTYGDWANLHSVNDDIAPMLKEINALESQLLRDQKKFEAKRTGQAHIRMQESLNALAAAFADWDKRSPAAFDAYERVDKSRLELVREVLRRNARVSADAARARHDSARATSRAADAFQPRADIDAFIAHVDVPKRVTTDEAGPASPALSATPSASGGGGLKSAFNRLSRLPQADLFARRPTSSLGVNAQEKEALAGARQGDLLAPPSATVRHSVALPSEALENARSASRQSTVHPTGALADMQELQETHVSDDAALERVREQLQKQQVTEAPAEAPAGAPTREPAMEAPAGAPTREPVIEAPAGAPTREPVMEAPAGEVVETAVPEVPAAPVAAPAMPNASTRIPAPMSFPASAPATTPTSVPVSVPVSAPVSAPLPQRTATTDVLHVDAFVTERVHASLTRSAVARLVVVGEVALALREPPTALHTTHARIHVESHAPLDKVAVNPSIGTEITQYSYDVHLGAVWQAQTSAGVAVVTRYQLHIDPSEAHRYVPLNLRAQWKCEAQQSSLLFTYGANANSLFAEHGASIDALAFQVALPATQRVVGSVLSRPTGEWDPGLQQLAWRTPALPPKDTSSHQLLARFPLAETGAPVAVEAAWEAPVTVGARGVYIDQTTHIAEVVLVNTTHRTVAGKYYYLDV